MLSTQDFAREVWLSLENVRERLASLETEARHTRRHLQRLEERIYPVYPARSGGSNEAGRGRENSDDRGRDNGASINLRISRRALGGIGGGGAIGGGLLAGAAGAGRALGWW